jgi:hypothetical protein
MAPIRSGVQVVLVVGVLVGIWHLLFATGAVFVFRNGEPWWSWLAVLLGPGLTLVAVLIAIVRARFGGVALIAGGCLSLLALVIGDGPQYSTVLPFFLRVSLPMFGLGAALLAMSRPTRKLAPVESASNAP